MGGKERRGSDHVAFFHAAPGTDVASIQAGIDPGPNDFAQYGRGFYTFVDRHAAVQWGRIKLRLLGDAEEYAVLEFRIARSVWAKLRRKGVPDNMWVWQIPPEWLTDYDVLEGRWGVTDDTQEMEGVWQVKFNPSTYPILNAALVRSEKEEGT